jgi:hypothetical protein
MMTREELRSSSITPAIENIYLSSKPLSPEEKAQMLREIDGLIRRHNLRPADAEAQLRFDY